MARYRRQLRDWETERERQINEFTITEKDLATTKSSKAGSTAVHSTKKGRSTPGKSAPNVLRINKSKSQDNLYTAQPKEKTYKSYQV